MSSSISGTTMAQNQSSTTPLNQNATLGKDAFLQLLVAQMQNQNPLQPKDNTQMIAQLAQFSSLEQMTNIANGQNQLLSTMQSLESLTAMAYEHQLIGTNVSVDDGNGNTVTGQVSGIKFAQGVPQVVVNGNSYGLSQVVQMS